MTIGHSMKAKVCKCRACPSAAGHLRNARSVLLGCKPWQGTRPILRGQAVRPLFQPRWRWVYAGGHRNCNCEGQRPKVRPSEGQRASDPAVARGSRLLIPAVCHRQPGGRLPPGSCLAARVRSCALLPRSGGGRDTAWPVKAGVHGLSRGAGRRAGRHDRKGGLEVARRHLLGAQVLLSCTAHWMNRGAPFAQQHQQAGSSWRSPNVKSPVHT